ncbi:MAG: 2Fe-2S iron-sulfur cluster-binding protein, partial [Alphaproteobacteria bacterium]|nr:2Fe-2S iron-sulfur cluster-binding protein [Alphaproteobacteria bacterium]
MTKVTEATVVFTPSGKRGTFAHGTSVLDAARVLGVDLDTVCGGRGICGRCQINVSAGDFAKFGISSRADHLSPFGPAEQHYAEKRGLAEGRRLGCHSQILGDLVIDVPEESQVHRQVVRKRAEARSIEIDPLVRLCYVEVREPDMHDPTGDLERLKEALRDQWGVEVGAADLHALQALQPALRKGKWTATAAVRGDGALIHVWPGFHDRAFGLAIDVGTTTVAAHLTDLASGEVPASVGAMNPQIRFGEDLMSRVSYIMMHPGG